MEEKRVAETLKGESKGWRVQESCKYERETDFCGRSARSKEILLDVRDVCFASRATTVEPEERENQKIEPTLCVSRAIRLASGKGIEL